MAPTPDFHQLAETLGTHLYPPRPMEDTDLAALLSPLVKARQQMLQSGQHAVSLELRAALDDTVVHLHNLALARRSSAMLNATLSGLLRLGPSGWHMTGRLLVRGNVNPSVCTSLLDSLPSHCLPGLLHALLPVRHELDKALVSWMDSLANQCSDISDAELQTFALELNLDGERISSVLQAKLCTTAFSSALLQNALTSSSAMLRSCRCVHALRLADTAKQLLLRCVKHPRLASPEAIRRLAGTLSPDDATSLQALELLARSSGILKLIPTAIVGLDRLGSPCVGELVESLCAKSPQLAHALPNLVPTLTAPDAHAFLKPLPPGQRQQACATMMQCITELQPGFTERLATEPALFGTESLTAHAAAASRVREQRLDSLKLQTPQPPAARPCQANGNALKRLFRKKQSSLGELLENTPNPRDHQRPQSVLHNSAFQGRTISNLDIHESHFHQVQFVGTTFFGVDFSDSTLLEADFTGCTFTNCCFRNTRLHETRLQDCQLIRCDFTDSMFTNCELESCAIEYSVLGSVLWDTCAFRLFRFRGCTLTRCRFQHCELLSVLMRCLWVTGTVWHQTTFAGTTWLYSSLRHTIFHEIESQSCEMQHCTVQNSRVFGAATGLPSVDMDEIRQQSILAEQFCVKALRTSAAPPNATFASVAPKPTIVWCRLRSIRIQETKMRRNNQRRIRLAQQTAQDTPFLTIVPFLISSTVFEEAQGLQGVPVCRIAGYTPDPTTLDLVKQWFPSSSATPPQGSPLIIASLSTIGSVGTVAQTRHSDADFWVCYDADSAPPKAVEGLRNKLDALSRWAEETFGVEAHFFLMRQEDVKQNNFGFSDKESSGTAQALMLKEEYYRTCVILAGKIPGWWLTPPECSATHYGAWLNMAQSDPLAQPRRFMDNGHAAPVPASEFLGAALWQIVKGIDSPFKSILKLGLLEQYAHEGPTRPLLCDRIKRDILRGHEAAPADPYTAMARTVCNHYRALDNAEAMQLVPRALRLKTEMQTWPRLSSIPVEHEHAHLLKLFSKASTFSQVSAPAPVSFAQALRFGNDISRHMISSYTRIRNTPQARAKAAIDPADLTRLGRRIAVNYASKKNKIQRVPILGIPQRHFAELHLSAQKNPGKPTTWTIAGKAGKKGRAHAEQYEILARSPLPIRMFAWMVFNKLYTPDALLHADQNIAPLSTPDVRNILNKLDRSLITSTTFNIDPDTFLRQERITRALLVANLTAPPESDKLLDLTAVYTTNWGEVFCTRLDEPQNALKSGLHAYLKSMLPHAQPVPPEIQVYYPKRSLCPRLKLVSSSGR
ncbi:class I adenylate cyclase [Paucidesulfovibrio gracilis]|nr:class I adenylate cyclase [Paucidesulfovibrio gracilis]